MSLATLEHLENAPSMNVLALNIQRYVFMLNRFINTLLIFGHCRLSTSSSIIIYRPAGADALTFTID